MSVSTLLRCIIVRGSTGCMVICITTFDINYNLGNDL